MFLLCIGGIEIVTAIVTSCKILMLLGSNLRVALASAWFEVGVTRAERVLAFSSEKTPPLTCVRRNKFKT